MASKCPHPAHIRFWASLYEISYSFSRDWSPGRAWPLNLSLSFPNQTHRGRSFDLSRTGFCRARESDPAINFMTNGSDYILAGHLGLIYGITGAQEAEASRQFSRERPVIVSPLGLQRLID